MSAWWNRGVLHWWVLPVVALAGCGGGGAGDSGSSPDELVQAVSVDRRGAVLSELGGPDAFVITVDEVDGSVSRFETWSYFEAATQIDFVDGELLWDVEIDALPDGSWLPLMYDPMEFTMLASRADTLAALGDVDVRRVTNDADFEVSGAELWAGEQLLLMFVDDQLISVETFPLAPGVQEVAG
jgi:hypothetical protein